MIWRSLDYIYHMEIYDLISLPSKISILGYFQEDTEKYHGIYIMKDISMDIMEDIWYMMIIMKIMDIMMDPYWLWSNRDIIIELRKYRDHRYRSINHRSWDILVNILESIVRDRIYRFSMGFSENQVWFDFRWGVYGFSQNHRLSWKK